MVHMSDNSVSLIGLVTIFVMHVQHFMAYLAWLVQQWPPRGLGDLGRMAIYFQGAGEHW